MNIIKGNCTPTTAHYQASSIADFPSNVRNGLVAQESVYIDVDCSAGDIDASNYLPVGLVDGGFVTLRKVDTSAGKIVFSDDIGMLYDYVNRQGELLTLKYFKSENCLKVS